MATNPNGHQVPIRAIHDSHSPVGIGRLSRQKAHKLRAHGSNSSMGNGSTRIQVWISDRTQVPAGHGSPARWTILGDSPLARMGCDFMSAPGKHHDICISQNITNAIYSISASSCDVERAFSRGGLTVTKQKKVKLHR